MCVFCCVESSTTRGKVIDKSPWNESSISMGQVFNKIPGTPKGGGTSALVRVPRWHHTCGTRRGVVPQVGGFWKIRFVVLVRARILCHCECAVESAYKKSEYTIYGHKDGGLRVAGTRGGGQRCRDRSKPSAPSWEEQLEEPCPTSLSCSGICIHDTPLGALDTEVSM